MGLPTLTAAERHRIELANSMYWETCKLFGHCVSLGILVTLENPSRSLFWLTEPFLQLLAAFDIFFSNTQMCMMGGSRPKWTKLAASFSEISEMDVECDNSHSHLPWGKTLDDEGNEVFATSLEAQYPRKFCHALVQCVVRQLQRQGMQVLPDSLFDVRNERVFEMQTARISAQQQSRRSKLPPLISDVASVAVFFVQQPSDVPFSLQSKLDKPLNVFTESGMPAQVPKFARFLRRTATHSPFSVQGGLQNGDECFEVAFGMPWTPEQFISKAVERGHPANFCKLIPHDLEEVIEFHVQHSTSEVSEHRLSWCKRWLQRAAALDREEMQGATMRHPSTLKKRIKLTKEILESLQYEDIDALKILEEGSTLAGEIEGAKVFQQAYKPCLSTLEQLEENAEKRNLLVLSMTKSSASPDLDAAVLQETRDEVNKGWADGPWSLEQLEKGATVSRRFPLAQGEKVRMIDDYSVSGVNDSCTVNSKLDLHMIDTFVAVIKAYFEQMKGAMADSSLLAKTYDLKAAYRQIPVRKDHLKYAYFSIYNHERDTVEIYRSRTLPFGATHSVYLRLAKMLHFIACKGPKLLTTNFYDDFILASSPNLQDSAKNCLELVFMFTGWEYAIGMGRKPQPSPAYVQHWAFLLIFVTPRTVSWR